MSEDRISKADDKVGVSDLAFDRYEAEYERVLYMGKAYEMFGYEHQRMARRAMINLVIAECGVQSAGVLRSEDVSDLCHALEYTARALEEMAYNHHDSDVRTIREAIAALKVLTPQSATGACAACAEINARRCTNPKPVGDSACDCCQHHWHAIDKHTATDSRSAKE